MAVSVLQKTDEDESADMRTRRYTLYCAGANSRGLFIRNNIAERVREANRFVK